MKTKWLVLGGTLLLGVVAVAWAAEAQMETRARHEAGMFAPGGFGEHGMMAGHERAAGRLLAMLDNDRFKQSLGLSDQQAGKLRQIIVDTQKASIKTGADLGVRSVELRELLRADQPDRQAVMKKLDEIAALRSEMMKQRVNALLDAKNVLTPEQQKKVRTFLESRRFGGGEHRGFFPRGMEGRPPAPPATPEPPAPPQP